MALFIELHANGDAFLVNADTISSVGKDEKGLAVINRKGYTATLVDEPYEYVRDLLQGKVVRPSSAYEKEW